MATLPKTLTAQAVSRSSEPAINRPTITILRSPASIRLWLLAAWAYPALILAWFGVQWLVSGRPGALSGWLLLPAQGVAILAMLRMMHAVALDSWRWRGWCCLVVAALLDMVANGLWMYLASSRTVLYGSVADLFYFLNYASLVGACACFYAACGGRFANSRFAVDTLALALGTGASLLPFLLSPLFVTGTDAGELLTSIGYTVGIGSTAIMAAQLYMQVMNWHEEQSIGWVLLGVGIVVGGDLAAAAANIRGEALFGGLDTVLSCLVYAAFITATGSEYRAPRQRPPQYATNVHSFVPILSLFVAIAIVLGAEFTKAAGNVLLAAALAFVAAALLVMRQFTVRYEVERLNAQLAERAAEARVSELVRRSSDTIAVFGADRALRFVSPASLVMLGRTPESLFGTSVERMFGAEHELGVREVLAQVAAPRAPAELELRLIVDAQPRVVQLTVSDESRNSLIEGSVLTVRDVTELRGLEGALLDIATSERQRLCGDIHEGLGQHLTGIGLYLQSINLSRGRGAAAGPESLDKVIELVNAAVDQVRALARGLSPLEVVHRSLESALRVLAADVQRQFGIPMRLTADIDGASLTDLEADHLYRIVQEAVLNACRHGRGTAVDVNVRVREAQLTLVVADDGIGIAEGALDKGGLGLKMMRYRVQLLGGTVRIESAAGAGTRVSIGARRQRLPAV